LRLDATQQQKGFSRELPSIYLFSVSKEKCVAVKRKYFEVQQEGAGLSAVQDKQQWHGIIAPSDAIWRASV